MKELARRLDTSNALQVKTLSLLLSLLIILLDGFLVSRTAKV